MTTPASRSVNVVLLWDEELLQAIRALPPGPTVPSARVASRSCLTAATSGRPY